MFITTRRKRGGNIPDSIAEGFMDCMLKRGYTVEKMERDWKNWKHWVMFWQAE